MAVQDVMTDSLVTVTCQHTVAEAADLMAERAIGFLPIVDGENGALWGVVTDRDIVTRAVAKRLILDDTAIESIASQPVHHCLASDPIEVASLIMRDERVYRLVVFADKNSKQPCGVVTVGDVARYGQSVLASQAWEGILTQPEVPEEDES